MTTADDIPSFMTSPEGLVTLQSSFGPKETMKRLEAEIAAQGQRVFARINHGALAAETGQTLRPTELLIFGTPRAGTLLMQANQSIGIDLPLKALVWQDSAGTTWLTYNEPKVLAKRHGVDMENERAVGIMSLAIRLIAQKVTESARA